MRMSISISDKEADALREMAESKLRDPRDLVRVIIREVLEGAGFLPYSGLSEIWLSPPIIYFHDRREVTGE